MVFKLKYILPRCLKSMFNDFAQTMDQVRFPFFIGVVSVFACGCMTFGCARLKLSFIEHKP